ncbi:MAG: class I SAM-dependent methyltransferase [Candidatus Sumerlaeaceae bacterium]|nr:class I SAM-dependent methyltransferase [Candidatus Sumerlaeaceae bacterium]
MTEETSSQKDLAQIMRDLQAQASREMNLIERQLAELRDGLASPLAPESLAILHQTLGEANEMFERLNLRLGRLTPDTTLEMLAPLPGSGAGWINPKRWVNALMRVFLHRQENFNREVAARIARSSDWSVTSDLFAVTARLLATLNQFAGQVRQREDADTAFWLKFSGILTSLMDEMRRFEAGISETARRMAKAAGRLPDKIKNATDAGSASSSTVTAGDLEVLAQRLAEQERVGAALAVRLALVEKERDGTVSAASLTQMESRVTAWVQRELESAHAAMPPPLAAVVPISEQQLPAGVDVPAFDFLAFENLTRGTEARIASEQQKYLPWFAGATNVLDAGCGRGEFLEILREAGVDAYGLDSDQHMVDHCASHGLRVVLGQLFAHLNEVPDESLGGIFLGQVVEHLPTESLGALAATAFRKLKPGAAIVMETINPTCLTTFSGAFYADPTHVKPVHPKALEYFLTQAGFGGINLIFSAPVPNTDKLAPLREPAPLDPAIKDVVLQINANFDRLNSVLYSYGNYAIAARRPA